MTDIAAAVSRHAPDVILAHDGFRIKCPCGWISPPTLNTSTAPFYCANERFERALRGVDLGP